MDTKELDLTVHHFVPYETDDASGLSSQQLFRDAARLVADTMRETKWCTPHKVNNADFVLRSRCFQFNAPVPRAPTLAEAPQTGQRVRSPQPMREWDVGTTVSDDDFETWTLSELEEFDHGNLHCRLHSPPTAQLLNGTGPGGTHDNQQHLNLRCSPGPQHSTSVKRPSDATFSISQLHKRRRLDDSSLRGALPLPHFYPAPFFLYEHSSSLLQTAAFPTSNMVVPIPPHTNESCEAYILDPYARLAWIIPVRGCLHWEGATSASVITEALDNDPTQSGRPVPTPASDDFNEIVWTRDSLAAFWDFLKNLRSAQNLGPLSVAFYVAPSQSSTSPIEPGSYKQMTPTTFPEPILSYPADSLDTRRSTLRKMDHFKLYHDAAHTKAIRSVLHSWYYRGEEQRIRLVKGARLVLLDERQEGILLC